MACFNYFDIGLHYDIVYNKDMSMKELIHINFLLDQYAFMTLYFIKITLYKIKLYLKRF